MEKGTTHGTLAGPFGRRIAFHFATVQSSAAITTSASPASKGGLTARTKSGQYQQQKAGGRHGCF